MAGKSIVTHSTKYLIRYPQHFEQIIAEYYTTFKECLAANPWLYNVFQKYIPSAYTRDTPNDDSVKMLMCVELFLRNSPVLLKIYHWIKVPQKDFDRKSTEFLRMVIFIKQNRKWLKNIMHVAYPSECDEAAIIMENLIIILESMKNEKSQGLSMNVTKFYAILADFMQNDLIQKSSFGTENVQRLRNLLGIVTNLVNTKVQ